MWDGVASRGWGIGRVMLWFRPLWRWFQNWRDRRATLRELEDHQRAEEAFLMDRDINPIHLAKSYLDRDEPLTAAAHWERACLLMPNTTLKSEDSLDILLRLKRYDEADALMRERVRRISGDRFYLIGLARIAEEQGDIVEALKRWEIARDRTRDRPEGYLGCARCLSELDRLREAEDQFDSGLRRMLDKIPALLGRARISDRRADWPQSLLRWKDLAENHGFATGFAFAANALSELGRVDEAEAYLSEPSRIHPRNLEIAVTRAWLAFRRGDLSATCDRWNVVRGIAPNFAGGFRDGVQCLVAAERHGAADAVLRTAIERFPDQPWPLADFARLAHDRRDWNEAAARWEALRRQFPAEDAGYALGAEALRAAGRDDEAAALHRG
jgi:tetratricopeptide (TPR) repeat protein